MIKRFNKACRKIIELIKLQCYNNEMDDSNFSRFLRIVHQSDFAPVKNM